MSGLFGANKLANHNDNSILSNNTKNHGLNEWLKTRIDQSTEMYNEILPAYSHSINVAMHLQVGKTATSIINGHILVAGWWME